MNIVGGRSVGQTEIICGVVIFIDDGWMGGWHDRINFSAEDFKRMIIWVGVGDNDAVALTVNVFVDKVPAKLIRF